MTRMDAKIMINLCYSSNESTQVPEMPHLFQSSVFLTVTHKIKLQKKFMQCNERNERQKKVKSLKL